MKRELFINSILGIISLVIIGLIIIHAAPAQTVQNNRSTISMNDFTRHNTAGDCWIRINGSIYDVTNFLNEHPGGPERILPFCGGMEATDAFATKGGRGTHSSRADQLLQNLFIGTLSP